jgi:nucleoside-diphosphate-sugar epimerase
VSGTAFVTGGSGFVGGRLIERLATEGRKVRALARSDSAAAKVEALGAEAVPGDITDLASLGGAAEGCEVTFHAAAHLGDWGRPEEFERGNVGGTRNVLDASAAAGVKRFVHVSTEAVLIAGEPLVDVDETARRRPDSKSLYSATKARAEELVVNANRPEFETVVVRPRFIWGAGDTTLLPALVEMTRKGRLAWIDGGKNRTDITHVDNVVEGLLRAEERGRGGEVYFVTDGEPVVFREFVSELLRTQGVEPPDRTVPSAVAGPLAATSETLWRLLRLPGSPPLTRFAFWVSSQECTIDIAKARGELGYAPIRSREDGLAQLRAA